MGRVGVGVKVIQFLIRIIDISFAFPRQAGGAGETLSALKPLGAGGGSESAADTKKGSSTPCRFYAFSLPIRLDSAIPPVILI
jgi:hypothetical protein